MKAFFFNDFKTAYIPEILTEIYKDKVYEPYLQGKKDLIILDIGANIWLTTYYFSHFAKQVYSFEPAKSHFKVLSKMVEFNKLDNVTLLNLAIGKETKKTKFYHNTNATMYSLKKEVNNKQEFEEVDVVTIDKFINDNKLDRIDFMKLDIEGSEAEVVCGKGFQKVASKIKVILGEYHTWSGVNPMQIVTTLSDYGFEANWLNRTDAKLFVGIRK